jgi:hypothetical protein
MANPGAPPPASINLAPTDPNYPTFIEGGCYVVDYGDPVYTVQAVDDPFQLDPRDQVAFVGGSGPTYTWNVTLGYNIKFGIPNFTVQLDPAYDGVFGPAFITISPGGGYTSGGAKTNIVPITALEGNYSFAVRVMDTNAPPNNTSTYVWPNAVSLRRPLNFAILSDPLSQGGNLAVTNLQSDLGFLYGAGSVTTINLASGTLTSGQLNTYDCIFWCSDIPFSAAGGTWVSGNTNYPQAPFGFTLGTSSGNVTEVVNQVNSGKTFFYGGGGARGLARTTTVGTSLAPYTNASTWWFDGPTGNYHNFEGVLQTVPNIAAGFDTWRSGSLGPARQVQNIGTTQGTSTKCVRGYFTGIGFVAGAFRTGIGAGLGRAFELNFNYGDMTATQGATIGGGLRQRHLLLENMLCMGSAASRFNSPNT